MNPETYQRSERAVYNVAQTHLREFEAERVDLYPEDTDDGQRLVADGGVDTAVWYDELNAFQRDVLRGIRAIEQRPEDQSGLNIKRELETWYNAEINHGRLYPNLDILADKGLVEKSKLDNRTNKYELSDEGRRLLEATVALDTQLVTESTLAPRAGGDD